MKGVNVWVGDYGTYPVPEELSKSTVFTKSGWPDKRYKAYHAFMDWVENKERQRRRGNGST